MANRRTPSREFISIKRFIERERAKRRLDFDDDGEMDKPQTPKRFKIIDVCERDIPKIHEEKIEEPCGISYRPRTVPKTAPKEIANVFRIVHGPMMAGKIRDAATTQRKL